jgi:DNA-binding Lrp family transcriptional regulator
MIFDFNKQEYNYIKENLILNEEMSKILEMKIKRYSITKIAMELNMSERTINRRIKELKRKITKLM